MNTWLEVPVSTCVDEWKGWSLGCLHCRAQWRMVFVWFCFFFFFKKNCISRQAHTHTQPKISVEAIKPVFIPTSTCMYTFYERNSTVRWKAINMIICVFSIHLQAQHSSSSSSSGGGGGSSGRSRSLCLCSYTRVIHFNVPTENIFHCFSILTDRRQHTHPFIIPQPYWISLPCLLQTVFVIYFVIKRGG